MFRTPTHKPVADMGWNPICLVLRQITGGCGGMPANLARTGLAVFALLFGITLLTEHVAAGRALVASTSAFDLPPRREVVPPRLEIATALVVVAGSETAPATIATETRLAAVVAPPVVPAAAAVVGPIQNDAVVLASWYGPGFYGNPTACGLLFTPEILGVAHLTLPCGTPLNLTYGGRSVRVTVIDRGPFIAGRAIDLSSATKLALGCTDLCTVRMQILR
jgi:rare lipoprotein A (peptidoglycan hydrolase)